MSARRIPYPLLLALTLAALLAAAAFSLSWGRYPIPLNAVWQTLAGQNPDETYANIIFNLRLPRIAAAVLVGAALSLAGAVYQGIFRNPLVSPDLLGVSSGACVGAAAAATAAGEAPLMTILAQNGPFRQQPPVTHVSFHVREVASDRPAGT